MNSIIEQVKERIKQYRDNIPSRTIDVGMIHIRLTHEQSLSIEDGYKDSPFTGKSTSTNNTVLGGIRTYPTDNESQSGLYVRNDNAPNATSWYTRVGEPFTMNDPRHTSKRLNDIRASRVPEGMPSDEEQQALVDWIVKSNVSELGELPDMPEWYKPVAAYHQLRSLDATDHGKLAPWDVPTEWVHKLSAVLLCTMRASRTIHTQMEEEAQAQIEQSKRNPPAQSKYPIEKMDNRGGSA